jgi:hypothetical protein
VESTANAALVGTYRLDAIDVGADKLIGSALDSARQLYGFAKGDGGSDLVARFTLSSEPVVVYDEAQEPVKIHASRLVTGN